MAMVSSKFLAPDRVVFHEQCTFKIEDKYESIILRFDPNVEYKNDNVQIIMDKLQKATGIPVEDQTLTYFGKVLKPDESISALKLGSDLSCRL